MTYSETRVEELLITSNMGSPTIVVKNARGEFKLDSMSIKGGNVFEAARKVTQG